MRKGSGAAFICVACFLYPIDARLPNDVYACISRETTMTVKISQNLLSSHVIDRECCAMLEKARDRLIVRVKDVELPAERCLRVEEEIPPFPFLAWLASQCHSSRYYWCDRTRCTEMAGIGEAHVVAPEGSAFIPDALRRVHDMLPENSPDARYYGGFRFHFHEEQKGRRWKNFKICRFVLPLVEMFRNGDGCHIACTLNGENGRRAALESLEGLRFDVLIPEASLPQFAKRVDVPDHAAWCGLVNQALSDMDASKLEKVVLARETTFQTSSPVDPFGLMVRLALSTRQVYLFCFQPGPGRAFLGASPECLFSRNRLRLRSEALAGTRRRDTVEDEDLVLEQALLVDEKERREHKIVVDVIKNTLSTLCSRIVVAQAPSIVKLSHCQHLITPIEGELLPGMGDEQLLTTLHPTPAVGGKPADAAVRWILEKEPFERGIYASPVGWVGNEASEFCVGIRSGLALDTSLVLYAGAGIVPGSDPEEEWRELDSKMAQFMSIIMKDENCESA